MSSVADDEFARFSHLRADVAVFGGDVGEGGEDVQFGEQARGFLKAGGVRGDAVAELDEEVVLEVAGALVGGEDFRFVFL